MNAFDTMRAALDEARDATRAADQYAGQMARMLLGRLHHVNEHTLVELKRELQRFDATRKEWKR